MYWTVISRAGPGLDWIVNVMKSNCAFNFYVFVFKGAV
jgi:hypothetical protein